MVYYGKREWLLKLRKEKGFSQDLTAALSGISQALYHKIEAGYFNPNQEQAARIAETLGITYDDFIKADEEARRSAV